MMSVPRDPRKIPVPILLAVTLALIIGIALIVASMTSAAAFGAYNPDWDGTSDFRTAVDSNPDVEQVIAQRTAQYTEYDPEETVAFVVAPDRSYDGDDADVVTRFVEEGGTLVVLENFGVPGDDLLATVGADARVDGRLVLDEQRNDEGPAMPLATVNNSHERLTMVDQLTLNYATPIEPNSATVLANTSAYSYLGQNATDEPASNDVLESYPVATTESVGNGTVVAVGDPSITINAMYGKPTNAKFLAALYADADNVVIDVSHAEDLPPLTAVLLTVRSTPALQGLLGLGGVGIAIGLSTGRVTATTQAIRRRLISKTKSQSHDRPGLSEAELRTIVRHRHPEWGDDRIEEAIAALNYHKSKERANQ